MADKGRELTYSDWSRRIRASRELRKKWRTRVWDPLHDAWVGKMCLLQDGRYESVNAFATFVEVVAPQLLWDEPTALVQPYRIAPGTDPTRAVEFARTLQDQLTGLGRSIGYRDELVASMWDFFYSMGVMLFGFNPPLGIVRSGERDIDLDYANAQRAEKLDAGMPFARSISPHRFLGDDTFIQFQRGAWCGVEYFLTLEEFKVLYPKYKEDVKCTHKGEPWGDEESSGNEEGQDEDLVLLVDIYDRMGKRLTLPDERSGVKAIVKQQPLDLGIEGLPVQVLGRAWSRKSPYPIPPMSSWYQSARDQNSFLDKLMEEGTKVRQAMFIDKSRNPGLADQVRNSRNQGVIEVDGDPRGLIETAKLGAVSKDDVDIYQLAVEVTEKGSGTSQFQLGQRQPGEMTAREAGALENATNLRLETMRTPVHRFAAEGYRKLAAILYSKLDLLAGMGFALGEGEDLRFAVIDPNRPQIGEILDYSFDVGVAETSRLSQAELAQNRRELLEMYLRPDIQQALMAEGIQPQIAPIFREMLRDMRAKSLVATLVQAPPPPPPIPEQQMGPEQGGAPAGPGTAVPAPPVNAPEQGATPVQGDPVEAYLAILDQLQQIPEGDPAEQELLAQLAGLRQQFEAAGGVAA